MNTQIQAIVINYIKYKESSIIAKVFCREMGLISLEINGIRKSKPKWGIGLMEPLTLLDLQIYFRQNQPIYRVVEMTAFYSFTSAYSHPYKRSVFLFMAEVLKLSLTNDHIESDFYDNLVLIIKEIDVRAHNYQDLHLIFLIKIMDLMGVLPDSINEWVEFFPSQNVNNNIKTFLKMMINNDIESDFTFTNLERNSVLNAFLAYIRSHHVGKFELKSLEVFKEIWN